MHILRATNDYVLVLFRNCELPKRQSLAKALVWLCQTLRVAPNESYTRLYQSSTWSGLEYRLWQNDFVSAYILKPLKELHIHPDHGCWQELFQSGIVSYRSLSREWGYGLEIPFNMMIQLTAVENYFWLEDAEDDASKESCSGGYLLYGFYTALVPTRYDVASNRVQWHFESSKGKIIDPRKLQSTRASWVKHRRYDHFANCTCFIGWCEVAHIMLGTKALFDMNTFAWSGLPTRSRTLHKRGNTLVGQLGLPSPVQATIQAEMTFTFVNNIQTFSASDSYALAIEEVSHHVCLVYDSTAGKAWLVPKLSLLLHLCHTYFARPLSSSSQATPEDPIPFAIPSYDGSQAARDALFNKGDVVVRWHGTEKIDKILLRQVLVDINRNISDTSRTRELPHKDTLLAPELMSMVDKPGMFNGLAEMTSKAAFDSWSSLVEYVDAVFVCSNLGPAIQPALPAVLHSCNCVDIPSNKQYLAVHMQCLDVIFRRRGIKMDQLSREVLKINKDHDWCLNGQPFRGCQHGGQQSDFWADLDSIV